VEVTGPNRDLHSGLYVVQQSNQYFSKMIACFMMKKQYITIPGFTTMSKNYLLKKELKWQSPFSLEKYKKALDLKKTSMAKKGYVTNERNSIRPTLDVNGIWGGYTGAGAKNSYRKSGLLKSPCV
jgi:hypothetical protein